MSRYTPSDHEKYMIGRLVAAGWTVVRRRTYDRLLERARVAEALQVWETERRQGTEKWAHEAFVEQRRLADRLDRVVAAAAALGVSIQDINTALDGVQP